MKVTTISSSVFDQDPSSAMRAASEGPAFITDRGSVAYVLLSIEAYRRLASSPTNVIEAVGMPGGGDIEFDP